MSEVGCQKEKGTGKENRAKWRRVYLGDEIWEALN